MLEPDEVDLLNIVELRRELRHALQWRTDKVRDRATQAESDRWATRLNWIHNTHDVDGSGTDSGDALDVIESEIKQAIGKYETEQETFPDIRAAMRALQDAKALRCICTGFVIQYEGGCCCAHGKAVKLAKDNLKQLLEAL